MNPGDAFDRILASLYRATLDEARWPATSALIEEACGAVGSGLVVGERFGGDDRIHFARFLYRGESRQDLTRQYFNVHYPHDASMRRLMGRPEGRPIHLPDLFTDEELKRSPVYNEGWRRLEARNGLYAHFANPDGLRIVWGVGDPVGRRGWESAQLRLLERLLPHIRQFVNVRQALSAAGALGVGLTGLLDNDRIGVVQLDRVARVMAANAPAADILRRGDGLFDRDGALQARHPADRRRLQTLLGRALPRLWGEAPSGGSMTVQRDSGRSRLGLHVSPVGAAEADFGGRRVAALVLVIDPARGPRIDPVQVSVLLGLTPSEGRVSALLAEGLSVREIAATTGLAENYVRWLFQQVYRKLGVSRQVALVRQVLASDTLPRG
ncbi:MAG: helix-turn-helix transcriptional regulator [Rhodospirillaceae bacterium]|nr:helix-turn-helix transcriptional regulator [Rhodospirillaceae bacterium]